MFSTLRFPAVAVCASPMFLVGGVFAEELRPVDGLLAEISAGLERTAQHEGDGWAHGWGPVGSHPTGAEPVEQAVSAEAWVEGWRRARKGGDPDTLQRQLEALPGPGTWAALRSEAADEPTLAVLVARLAGDEAATDAALANLPNNESLVESIAAVRGTLPDADPRASFEAELGEAENGPYPSWLSVPALVPLLGEEVAEPLLRRMLGVRGLRTSWWAADETTTRLVRELIVAEPDAVRAEPWGALHSLEAVAAWEALDPERRRKRPASRPGFLARLFGAEDPGADFEFDHEGEALSEAWAWHVGGLVAAGRVDDAATELRAGPPAGPGISTSTPYGLLDALSQRGHAAAVADLLDRLLAEDPTLPLWRLYREAAVRADAGDRLMERLEAALANASGARTTDLRRELALAGKAVAATVEQARSAHAAWSALPPGPDTTAIARQTDLLRVGRLFDDADLIAESLAALRSLADGPAELRFGWSDDPESELLRGDPTPERLRLAEDLALRRLGAAGGVGRHVTAQDATGALTTLLRVRAAAEDHAAVLALLREGEAWGVADAVELFDSSEERTGLGALIAATLRARGEDEAAAAVALAAVRAAPGSDAAYRELLATHSPEQALELLEAEAAADPYEERPLIWKARLLLDGGDAAGAIEVAKRAIAIDPSDGEQPAGDRMRVYAVLADALAERGDDAGAETYRRVVQAIRISERADLLHLAGFQTLAIRGYEEALRTFSDAYCIQSRLAVRLMAAGRLEQARTHFRRAFELMPDSFGRVESHCFGCEGAFEGPLAQGVAEAVFEGLARGQPDDAQVPYLVGYLAAERGDLAAAEAGYRAAVELDPLYLNAWSRRFQLGEERPLPAGERDEALFTVIRLDPLARHARGDTDQAHDLAALWEALEHAAAVRESRTADRPVFPLPASAAALEDQATREPFEGWGRSHSGRPSPGEAIAAHPVGQLTIELGVQAAP